MRIHRRSPELSPGETQTTHQCRGKVGAGGTICRELGTDSGSETHASVWFIAAQRAAIDGAGIADTQLQMAIPKAEFATQLQRPLLTERAAWLPTEQF